MKKIYKILLLCFIFLTNNDMKSFENKMDRMISKKLSPELPEKGIEDIKNIENIPGLLYQESQRIVELIKGPKLETALKASMKKNKISKITSDIHKFDHLSEDNKIKAEEKKSEEKKLSFDIDKLLPDLANVKKFNDKVDFISALNNKFKNTEEEIAVRIIREFGRYHMFHSRELIKFYQETINKGKVSGNTMDRIKARIGGVSYNKLNRLLQKCSLENLLNGVIMGRQPVHPDIIKNIFSLINAINVLKFIEYIYYISNEFSASHLNMDLDENLLKDVIGGIDDKHKELYSSNISVYIKESVQRVFFKKMIDELKSFFTYEELTLAKEAFGILKYSSDRNEKVIVSDVLNIIKYQESLDILQQQALLSHYMRSGLLEVKPAKQNTIDKQTNKAIDITMLDQKLNGFYKFGDLGDSSLYIFTARDNRFDLNRVKVVFIQEKELVNKEGFFSCCSGKKTMKMREFAQITVDGHKAEVILEKLKAKIKNNPNVINKAVERVRAFQGLSDKILSNDTNRINNDIALHNILIILLGDSKGDNVLNIDSIMNSAGDNDKKSIEKEIKSYQDIKETDSFKFKIPLKGLFAGQGQIQAIRASIQSMVFIINLIKSIDTTKIKNANELINEIFKILDAPSCLYDIDKSKIGDAIAYCFQKKFKKEITNKLGEGTLYISNYTMSLVMNKLIKNFSSFQGDNNLEKNIVDFIQGLALKLNEESLFKSETTPYSDFEKNNRVNIQKIGEMVEKRIKKSVNKTINTPKKK